MTESFITLKPTCVELSQITFLPYDQWDLKSLTAVLIKLNNQLSELNEIASSVADYTFYPISRILIHIDTLNDKLIIIQLLKVISRLIKVSWTLQFNLNLATEVFPFLNLLCQQLQKTKAKSTTNDSQLTQSEKLILTETFHNFINAIKEQPYHNEFFHRNDVDVQSNFILLSHLTDLILLQLSILTDNSTNTDSSLQLQIISTLSALYQHILDFDHGETLSHILPGNISSLVKFLSNSKNNYKPITEALVLLRFLITTVYNDESLALSKESKVSKSIHRDIKWLNATREQIKMALTGVLPLLLRRNNIIVNKEISKLMYECLNNCSQSLGPVCKDLFVEYLVKTETNLQEYSHIDDSSSIITNKETIHLINQGKSDYLAHLIRNLSTDLQLNKIDEIKYMNFILSTNINEIKINETLIDKIFSQILGSMQLSSATNKLKERSQNQNQIVIQSNNVVIKDLPSVSTFNSLYNISNDDRINKRSWDKDLESEIIQLLKYVGAYSNYSSAFIDTVLNHTHWARSDLFEDEVNSEEMNNKELLVTNTNLLWIALNLLPDHSDENNSPKDEIDIFLNINDMDVTKYNKDQNDINLKQKQDIEDSCLILLDHALNTLQQNEILNTDPENITSEQEKLVCTTLLIIQRSCQLLGRNFQDELIDFLYVVVENLASSSPQIRHYSQSCIQTLANTLYNGSIHQLIEENIDYLIESISQRLNMGMTQRVTSLLMVIFKMTGYNAILSFQDILETIFQMLEYYHGYNDLCLQIFQLFEVIINEMEIKYIKGADLQLDSNSLNKGSFGLWDCQNDLQLSKLLKISLKSGNNILLEKDTSIPFDPNEPKSFQEYFDSKLKIQEVSEEGDSDDEDINTGDMAYNDQTIEKEATDEKKERDEVKWVSPIPRESYRLLIQIIQYGCRLLTHNSKSLKIQILKIIKLAIPLLASQYDSLLPQVAQVWDCVVECLLHKDYSIIHAASSTTEIIIKFAGDFIVRRFIDLWNELQDKSSLLKEINIKNGDIFTSSFSRSQKQVIKAKEFPPMTKNTLIAMSYMLLEGISWTEFILDENTLKGIIVCCLQVIPIDDIAKRSLLLGDIVCYLQNRK